MGRKKKFIDKRHSAVFQLFSRDTADDPSLGPNPTPTDTASDRVFARVDRNPYSNPNFLEEDEAENLTNADEDPDLSIFADADEDNHNDNDYGSTISTRSLGGKLPSLAGTQFRGGRGKLPDHVRKEILELGLPDDGYNYLLHLREIKNSGGGASYHQNHKARMDLVPLDVKAYDASRIRVRDRFGEVDDSSVMTAVAAKTVPVRVKKAVDEEVVRLLDDGEWSMFGSDVEELEENFVIKANLPEEGEEEDEEEEEDVVVKANVRGEGDVVDKSSGVAGWLESCVDGHGSVDATRGHGAEDTDDFGVEKERTRRLLDAQFDLLAIREYGSDCDDNDVRYEENEAKALAVKINDALKDYHVDDLELEDKYKVPGDFKLHDPESGKSALASSSAEIKRKCAEYAEMYSQENEDNVEVVLFEESSDESEIWDCETIVSTYSNLDNHPGKIPVPEKLRKKFPQLLPGALGEKCNVITLKGKEKLPVDFLPNSNKVLSEKVKKMPGSGPEQPQKKRLQEESKEEKKERKAAVKEEKKEARRAKKELKGLYRCEAQRAQKVAAFSGPSSIRLM